MKYLHRINIVIFILNGILFLTIIYGFAFLMVTGVIQTLINVYLYSNYNKLSIEFQKKLNTHSIISVIILTLFFSAINLPDLNYGLNSIFGISSVLLSIPLGIFHFSITSKIEKDEL